MSGQLLDRATGTRKDRRRRSRAGMGMVLVGALSTSGLAAVLTAGAASAAVPIFPDNLNVFPNRDFVSVTGYQNHVGETALLTVTRPGVGVVGSAQAKVAAGDVAFEVNHPGGVCWGAGTGLNVTPDIVPGDKVEISFGGGVVGDTTTQDGFVTEKSVLVGSTLTVKGHVGAGVNQAQTEQRIIEPLLTDTAIGRRDIRAIPGPLTPAANGGYSSSLVFSGTTFTATYVFLDPAVAQIAADASLGERLMAWEAVDAAGNRQGMTIAERGELGGPGMGGCPNGPLSSGPPGPTNVAAANVAGGVKLTWTPAVPVPGTAAITGYRATAIARTVTPAGEQVEIGQRINNGAATGTTITGLSSTETYDIEVVSVSSVGQTNPAVIVHPVNDITAPTVTASLATGSFPVAQQVSLSANEAGSEIYYTTDGTAPVTGSVLSLTAIHYTAPMAIPATMTLKFVAFDPTGNVSTIGERTYTITNTPVPATPTFTTTSAGAGSVTLNWASAVDTTITGYGVQVYTGANPATTVGLPRTAAAGVTTMTMIDLPTDIAYRFTVVAKNANGSSLESAMVGPLTPQGAVFANAGPDQTVVRKTTATTVNLTSAGSTAGATFSWQQVPSATTDPDHVVLNGATTASPTFSLSTFKYPATNKALTFRLTVTTSAGSKSDDVLVTPTADQVQIGVAKWKAGDLRVDGGGSVVGSTVTVHRGSMGGPILGQATMTAAAAPATGGAFSLRLRNAAAGTTSPGTVWIESNLGGMAGPFTVG